MSPFLDNTYDSIPACALSIDYKKLVAIKRQKEHEFYFVICLLCFYDGQFYASVLLQCISPKL